MTCPKCNAVINDDSEFCTKCGTQLKKKDSKTYASIKLDPPDPLFKLVGMLFVLVGIAGIAANIVGIVFRSKLFDEQYDENAVFFAIAACVYGIMFCFLYAIAGYRAYRQDDIPSCCGWAKALLWLTVGACAFYYLSSSALGERSVFSNIVAQVLIVWPIAFMVPMSYFALASKAKAKLPRA